MSIVPLVTSSVMVKDHFVIQLVQGRKNFLNQVRMNMIQSRPDEKAKNYVNLTPKIGNQTLVPLPTCSTGSRGDVFVVRTTKPVENL